MNHTLFEHIQDVYGCDVNIPNENQTLSACKEVYFERLLNKTNEEIISIGENNFKKFMSALSKEFDASKVERIQYFFQTLQNHNTTKSTVDEGNTKGVCAFNFLWYFFYFENYLLCRWIFLYLYFMMERIYQSVMSVTFL